MAACAKRSGQQSDTDCKMFHPILDQVNDYVILYRSLCFSSRNRKNMALQVRFAVERGQCVFDEDEQNEIVVER